jgi:hypothetical protein
MVRSSKSVTLLFKPLYALEDSFAKSVRILASNAFPSAYFPLRLLAVMAWSNQCITRFSDWLPDSGHLFVLKAARIVQRYSFIKQFPSVYHYLNSLLTPSSCGIVLLVRFYHCL